MTRLLMTMTVLLSGCVTAQTPPCNPPPWASAPDERPFVRAVSIGWNRVNPSAYNGWSGALTDCELDAEMWAGTWREAGIETVCLLTEEATIERCRVTLKSAVETLRAGDTLIVCISGHGGQYEDGSGDEADGMDEYVCAYDGPVLDDTICEWLGSVPTGVRVLWICDTCNSGTMYRGAPVCFRPAAIPPAFKGELILLAGCADGKTSASTGQGGAWSTALFDAGPHGKAPSEWFFDASTVIESRQVPVYAEYGAVTDAFRHGEIVP